MGDLTEILDSDETQLRRAQTFNERYKQTPFYANRNFKHYKFLTLSPIAYHISLLKLHTRTISCKSAKCK